MGMNLVHRWLCSSKRWEKASSTRLVPWALSGLDLGAATLEIGPGYGANVPTLRSRTGALTGLEIDPALAARLRARHGDGVRILEGDGAAMPLPDREFSSVVSFTMLHHVPSLELQDAVFAEALRVLRPGGTFVGCDGLDSLSFRLLHLGDTCVPVSPYTLKDRLARVGFSDIEVEKGVGSFRFQARRP
ncbi:class I SAM-dependent methyltransferase [Nocardia terpenica]|uniref:Methyltransferase domain-containing protein n=1 Tax=Nocardia terpenica TaxID=455432 RepID=A0A6G9Z7S2_9NOCA|nr:class I SAM-dependent methyltransferase [Nocardia terpenica]QIS21216.1 methyltransferase domain-containing protein [Nocardia terpenica]